LNARQMNAWLRFGDGAELRERSVEGIQLHRRGGGEYRRADGRLVPRRSSRWRT
jgi:hypothetical protein